MEAKKRVGRWIWPFQLGSATLGNGDAHALIHNPPCIPEFMHGTETYALCSYGCTHIYDKAQGIKYRQELVIK